MHADIDRVLISRTRIEQRIKELAQQITADHTPPRMNDAQITIVPLLTGALVFAADLIREMPLPLKVGLLAISSYPGKSIKSQGTTILGERVGDIRGRHVLVIDDILDSGETLRTVVPKMHELGAQTVKSCVLLRKDRPSARQTPVDYVGFEILDEFVVGYGLDFDDYYRNLPDIVVLKRLAGDEQQKQG
jgi:hypoxanthine phosphoribosyltransferase